jgi:pimeloyl-ACP methyl ester carboxylesterase
MTRTIHPYPGLDVTLTDTGTGDRTVLVLHGGAGPRGVATTVEHLAAGSRVLAPTHPGWDGTVRPEWFAGVDSLATIYLDLLEDEGIDDVVVIGSSFGGWVAAEMAVRDRAHVIGKLVLVDAIGPEVDGYRIELPGPRPGFEMPERDVANFQAYMGTSMCDPRLSRRLARVTAPTLLIWGEEDTIVPPGFGKAYADAFADSRFEVVPGTGHMPMLQDPTTTFRLIDDFLG